MQRDLLVFSHLRWTWVWQRPQHLIARIGRERRTWFVEEPWPTPDVTSPELRTERHGHVTRVWLAVPEDVGHVGFADTVLGHYAQGLPHIVGEADERVAWLYSPLALEAAAAVGHDVLVYDVMDDLSSFKDAPRHLLLRQRQTLELADVVFAGGRSLHTGIVDRRPDAHLFPSGVEPEHYEAARPFRARRSTPVAGYVGVIDERLDLELLRGLAAELPDWEIQMVGPVTKIDPVELPTAPNIRYLGSQPYERLPEVMGGFDVALMPFALNDATRSISPTKTLEYLAAGLPVVSTRVPDVVADYTDVVHLADDGPAFAAACRQVVQDDRAARDRRVRPLQARQEWDHIAQSMADHLETARSAAAGLAHGTEETA